MEELHIIEKLYDSTGNELNSGQICKCTPGSIAKKPYKVEIFKCYDNNLFFKGKRVKVPYLCTKLYPIFKKGHSAVIWPYWCKRLTIIK